MLHESAGREYIASPTRRRSRNPLAINGKNIFLMACSTHLAFERYSDPVLDSLLWNQFLAVERKIIACNKEKPAKLISCDEWFSVRYQSRYAFLFGFSRLIKFGDLFVQHDGKIN